MLVLIDKALFLTSSDFPKLSCYVLVSTMPDLFYVSTLVFAALRRFYRCTRELVLLIIKASMPCYCFPRGLPVFLKLDIYKRDPFLLGEGFPPAVIGYGTKAGFEECQKFILLI